MQNGEAVAELLQVNAIMPLTVTPGFDVPIVLTAGPPSSPSDAPIAVQ
jgi:hypothetical protein